MEHFEGGQFTEPLKERKLYIRKNIFLFFAIGILFLLVGYYFFFSAPRDFPVGQSVEVPQGMSLQALSSKLRNENFIRSPLLFKMFVILYGRESHIVAGIYSFDDRANVLKVTERVVGGGRFVAPVVVTIPEGFNNKEIADAFVSKLGNFNKDRFLTSAKEGYLFPDTYYFFTKDTDVEVIKAMTKNFEKKLASFRPKIIAKGKTEHEIITMASIIERESNGEDDRGLISGILWKRLSIGMPLQVDAAPITYKTKGLPKEPIANPGLRALEAALEPIKSSYLYYLHDKDGTIHYAKSFEEHRANIEKYLK